MFDIDFWLGTFCEKVKNVFKERVIFLGIQGSIGRGEATKNSDIDVVVILDTLSYADLKAYDEAISELPSRDKICGFVSGLSEITNWDRSDLFQFCRDTTPLYGSLDFLEKSVTVEDIRRAVHRGACDIYHMCVHNSVHEKSSELLKSLYKSAFFVLQAKSFLENGVYHRQKAELINVLKGTDKSVMKILINGNFDFDSGSKLMLSWSGELIEKFVF